MKHALPILILSGLTGACWWLSKQPLPEAVSPVAVSQTGQKELRLLPALSTESTRRPGTPIAPAPRRNLATQLTLALRSDSAIGRDHALNQLLPRLVSEDPSAAGHLALAWEKGPLRDELLAQFIRLWTDQDVGGALTWLTSLLDADDRRIAALAMVNSVAQSDRAGALDLARFLQVGLDDGSAERMAQLWTEEDPRAAVDWAIRQPSGPIRDRLLTRIVHVRAQQDPAEAARLVAHEFAPGPVRDHATLAVVRQWALRDTYAASTWVGAFPAGPLRESAVAELASAGQAHRL